MSILLPTGALYTKKAPVARSAPSEPKINLRGCRNMQENPTDDHLYSARSFTSGGSEHSRDTGKLQAQCWNRVKMVSNMSYMMIAITTLYFLGVFAGRVPDLPSRDFVFYAILLVCIPQINLSKVPYLSRTLTAAAILVLIHLQEKVMQRRQCLVGLLTLFLVSRVFQHKTFYDNFALCTAYAVSAAAINGKASGWYYTSNFLLWAYLVIALLLLYVYKRLWRRIWEHVRILLILTEKLKREDHIGRALIAAHIPADIQAHIFATQSDVCMENTLRSGKCFLQSTATPLAGPASTSSLRKPSKTPSRPAGATTETLRTAAVDASLLTDFSHAQLTLAQLQSLGGLDRRDCALVTIGFDGGVGEEAVHGTRQQECMHRMLDKLAAEHRITCVRKFGDVWVGCVGFFKTWESQYVNCYEAVLFASEAAFLGNSAGMTFAVDCGTVTGGFLRSLNFDFFGQEIRWLLMALELKLYGKVIVGDAVKRLLKAHQQKCPELGNFRCIDKSAAIPWRAGSHITVGVVDNIPDMVSPAAIASRLSQHTPEAAEAEKGKRAPSTSSHRTDSINWQVVRDLLSAEEAAAADAFTSDPRRPIHGPWGGGQPDVWQISDSEASLDQEIGEEFLLTATQRFRLSFDDPVLDGYTDQQLHDAHVRLETQLFAVIRKVCFPSLTQLLTLNNAFTDIAGQNEYKSLFENAWGSWLDTFFIVGPGLGRLPLLRACELLISRIFRRRDPAKSAPVDEFQQLGPETREKPAPTRSEMFVPIRQHKYRVVQVAPVAACIEEGDEEGEQEREQERDEDVESVTPLTNVPNPRTAVSPPHKEGRQNSDETFGSNVEIETQSSAEHKTAFPIHVQSRNTKKDRGDECARGWYKYAGDARMFFLTERLNSITTAIFYLVLVCGANVYVRHGHESSGHSTFLCGVALHMFVMLLLERQNDKYLAWVILTLDVVTLSALTFGYACGPSAFKVGSSTTPYFGDKGGEVASLLTTVILIPYHMRQPVFFAFWNCFLLVAVLIVRKGFVYAECGNVAQYRMLVVYMLMAFGAYYWALEYLAFASYLLEHKLLPAAVKNFRKQKANSRALLQAFAPHVPVSSACELYVQKPFRQAAIAALHVKVADQIAHFMDPRELSLILDRVHQVVEKSVQECGMLSVTHFSGVYLAVAGKDRTWDSVESLRFPDSHTARAVVFLRNVRGQLSMLSRELRFNIHIGIGIDRGPLVLGFLGEDRFCFDASSTARDLAVAMASFHPDGSFASDAFESDIRKMQAPEDLIRDVTDNLEPRRRRESRWLRIDGSFNGIQLEDFKYLCLLGQGGYGSVHLLAEKHTGVPYAIKAIELKQESKLSKMIERECSILQMVQHPNVVNLKYSFRNHNRLYLVMSYIRGGNLKQVVERDRLGLPHMLMWFAELVLAIEYLHSLGIIHRDVKPANCLIGTDGHLKLGDFGLSKVIGVQQAVLDSKSALLRDDALGLQSGSIEKVRKFLPLKLDATQREEQAEVTAHRTIRVLLITMDDSRADSTLLFINTTVEVAIADYDIDSDTIKLSQFEAIFIDGDYYEEDSPELVAHFCSHLFNGLPVLLCAKSEDLRARGLRAGARACSRLPLEALTEDTFESIFVSDRYLSTAADPLSKYRVDIIRCQDEKAAQLVLQEAALVSQYEKGLRNTNITRTGRRGSLEGGEDSLLTMSSQRNSVAVESRSHSLVGTLYFIAPEVIRLRRYGKAVDWWALGISIYECLVRGNHLFQGQDKKETLDNIMNAPIVLDALAPFGEAVISLVRGLLNRDIKRRLGSGLHGADAIKAHKLFSKMDWATVSTSNPVHKPAQFVNKKFRSDDRSLFYGPRRDHDAAPWSNQNTDLGSASMRKYISNKKRARLSTGGGGGGSNSSRSGRVDRRLLSAQRGNSGSKEVKG